MCVTCTFMTRSAAVGCIAKITNLNTSRDVLLQVTRTNNQQQINGCASNLSVGKYRVEVFDVEANGLQAETAAIVMNVQDDNGGAGTAQPSVSLPATVVLPSQSPSESLSPPCMVL